MNFIIPWSMFVMSLEELRDTFALCRHMIVEDHQVCVCVSNWLGLLRADVFKMASTPYQMQLTFCIWLIAITSAPCPTHLIFKFVFVLYAVWNRQDGLCIMFGSWTNGHKHSTQLKNITNIVQDRIHFGSMKNKCLYTKNNYNLDT
jgi:hypothetical protein